MATYVVTAGNTCNGLFIGQNDTYDSMNVLAEGIALLCTVRNGGAIHVVTGGVAEETSVDDEGGLTLDGGHGLSNTLNNGGIETIMNDGVETGATILFGGRIEIISGLCNQAVVSGGAIQASSGGIVQSTSVSSGGRIEILSGGKAQECEIDSDGKLQIMSSGNAQKNNILGGGLMEVYADARLISTTIGMTGAGTAELKICGGSSFFTSVYAGGIVTFDGSNALGSTTIIRGGAVSGGNLLLSSNSTEAHPGQCAVKFEDGGTATLSTLTIKTGGLMEVDSKTTVHFQNIVLEGNPNGFTMTGLAAYDPATGTCRKLLDCTAETTELWTDAQYRTLLNTTDEIFDSAFLYKNGDLYLRGAAHVSAGATGDEAFDTVQSALAMSPTALVIDGGDFTATANIPTFEGVTTTINGGDFHTSVCGGNFYHEGAADDTISRDISLMINGGTFDKIVFAGDRADTDMTLTRTGNISTTINGGEFNHSVAGAMAVTSNATTIVNRLVGNVFLTIKGGTFNNVNNKGWIYGGSIASTKTVAGTTTIFGNVTVTLDATDNAITVANLVAGSYGFGKIEKKEGGDGTDGNTNLVLTGANNITATGEIWGGCSGDVLLGTKIKKADETDSGNREVDSMVEGSRILTFTGFEGTLTSEANKIRAFSDIEVINGSKATVANAAGGSVNLSDVVNWTFGAPTGNWDEEDCMLTGNFINDFNGDTLNLTGFNLAGAYVLLTDSSRLDSNDVFGAFNQLSAIKMDDNTVSAEFSQNPEAQTMTWAWAGGESWLAGSLEVNRSTGKMTLVTQAVYT